MQLFYSDRIEGKVCRLNAEESGHCVKVLRHRKGDEIDVIDGKGTWMHCVLTADSPKEAVAEILSRQESWGGHPYHLHLAVCPTKSGERFEWAVEKATELGVDVITPVIGDRSERKVYKKDRALKIALSAAKQSLKAAVPVIEDPRSVREFIGSCTESLKLIAACFESGSPRRSIKAVLQDHESRDIAVLIGPEGDFSPEEVQLALRNGFLPIHLGASRLRTETAALTAAEAVYLHYLTA